MIYEINLVYFHHHFPLLHQKLRNHWIHNNQIMSSEIAINEYQVIGYSIIKNPAINDDQMLFLQEFLLP